MITPVNICQDNSHEHLSKDHEDRRSHSESDENSIEPDTTSGWQFPTGGKAIVEQILA